MSEHDDDRIGSWNGTRGTPQDKLAWGCAWAVGIIFGVMILGAVIEFVGMTAETIAHYRAPKAQP